MRLPEWLFVVYFAYVTVLGAVFPSRPYLHSQPIFYLIGAMVLFSLLNWLERGSSERPARILRDWLPLFLTLVAFREMEIFVPASYGLAFESSWIKIDQLVLGDWGLRQAIESFGIGLPFLLESCYLLVYGLAAYSLIWVAAQTDRRGINWFWTIYLTGTLGAYALFPYFPSLPPRYAFPLIQPPTIVTWMRTLNLWLLRHATIHSGVFPSAHVSSAFSAAWALYLILPRWRWVAHSMLVYAVFVSVATVYGRYHYVVDVLAGAGVSLAALVTGLALKKRYV